MFYSIIIYIVFIQTWLLNMNLSCHICNMSISAIFTQAPADDKSSSSTLAVVTVRKPKRDTDRTSESECDSGKENRRRSRIPKHRNGVTKRITPKETKGWRSERYFCTCISLHQKDVYTPKYYNHLFFYCVYVCTTWYCVVTANSPQILNTLYYLLIIWKTTVKTL